MCEVKVTSTSLANLDRQRAIDWKLATQILGDTGLQLRWRENGPIPIIHRLPNEILAEIITLLVHETRCYSYDADPSWIWVTHVCSLWRSIARSLPKLWSVIYTTQDQASIEEFVALSQNSPLSINAHRKLEQLEDVDISFFIPLKNMVGRIQHMKLCLGWQAMSDLVSLTDYTSTSAPLLETLELRYMPARAPTPLGQPWLLSNLKTSMPKLRMLSITDFPLSLVSNRARPTLTELRVDAVGPFDLRMWQTLVTRLPLLEVLHITSADVKDSWMIHPHQHPNTELRHLRELILSRKSSAPDRRGTCTEFLNKLIVPSSCKIQLPLAEPNALLTIDVLMSKKDGRACLGEPQVLTGLRAHEFGVQLWPEEMTECPSLPMPSEAPDELCPAGVRGFAKDLLDAMRQSPTFPFDAIQALCILGDLVKVQFITHFTHLRKLHLHQTEYEEWLEGIALLLPGALPHLRALTLDGVGWRSGMGKKPLNVAVDAFLAARRAAGTPMEALHLLRIQRMSDAKALSWLERMSSELPTFTWTWWPTEQDRASKRRAM